MKVKNINGTSANKCKCASWLDHWKKFSGKPTPSYCAQSSCVSRPTVGGHVQKDSVYDKDWYIIPLCDSHNRQATEMEVMDSTIFVSANVSQTCGS